MSAPTNRRYRTTTFAILITVALLATAATCDSSADIPEKISPAPELPEPPPPIPTPDLTPEEQDAVDEVAVMVDEFLTVYQQFLVDGVPQVDYTSIPMIGVGIILDDLAAEVIDHHANNRRGEGQLEWHLTGIEVDLDNVEELDQEEQVVPLVQLHYCLDATVWQLVDKDTGEPADPGQPQITPLPGARHLIAVSAYFYDPIPLSNEFPRWHLEGWKKEEDQPC